MKFVPDKEMHEYRKRTLNSNFKGAAMGSLDEVVYFNKKNAKKSQFLICKQHVYMVQVAIFFQKNSYLLKAFDDKIILLKENGIINNWISKYMDYSYANVKQPPKGPEILNVNRLLGGFYVFAFGLSISFFVFVFELLFHKFVKMKKKSMKTILTTQ